MFDVFYTGPKPGIFPFEQPASSLSEASELSRTNYFWYINGYNDYNKFDWCFRPVPWESQFTHIWPSQWQENGGTYLAKKGITEHSWHWQKTVIERKLPVPIYYIDFYNSESTVQFESLASKWQNVKRVRYVGSHLEVFKRIISQTDSEYIWITSSICDYESFDFTWHPSQWQAEMIHCFSRNASDEQKRGDTFYIHVESFKKQMYELDLLDWFNVIHYNQEQTVRYYPCPVVVYDDDDLISAIKQYSFAFPYAQFTKRGSSDFLWNNYMCLWAEKDRQVVSYSTNNSNCLVPKDIRTYLNTQIYDYPYVNTSGVMERSIPLDIVFISNREPDAEKWFEHLLEYANNKNVHRIQNVDGRAKAYRAAAEISETDWFFAVFAKLEVEPEFDWDWQPDYWQGPKHYIFHARNPVNGLVYGHQAMIAYNRKLVLETMDSGLDFTLSRAHEVVPILSGTAHYNQDAWTTWRTAFREVIKLKYFQSTAPTIETGYRLKKWMTVANGGYAEWSIQGSEDAVEYFESVCGDYDKLKLSFEWQWLKQYAVKKNYNF